MKRHVRRAPVPLELDVQRRRVARKRDPRRLPLRGAYRIRHSLRDRVGEELRSDGDVDASRQHGRVPGGEAARVAVVCAALGRRGVVEEAVVVELLAWVRLMDVDALAEEVIGGVFDGPLRRFLF